MSTVFVGSLFPAIKAFSIYISVPAVVTVATRYKKILRAKSMKKLRCQSSK